MSAQKRGINSVHYDREASPTRKITSATASQIPTSDSSPESRSSQHLQTTSESDISPSSHRIQITSKPSKPISLSFEERLAERIKYRNKLETMSEKELKSFLDAQTAKGKTLIIFDFFIESFFSRRKALWRSSSKYSCSERWH